MSSSIVILITGASRGIGLGLTQEYASRPSHTVLALVRDPSVASLSGLKHHESSKIIPLRYDASDPSSASAAIATAKDKHSISHIDVAYANAGIAGKFYNIAEAEVEDVQATFATNVLGTLTVFQAVFPLLSAAKSIHPQQEPKFIGVGSPAGSIAGQEQRPIPWTAYGISKAAMHWMVRKTHFENEGLCSFIVDPGFVRSDMGSDGAKSFGIPEPVMTVEDSVKLIVGVADGATRESVGGKYKAVEGDDFPW